MPQVYPYPPPVVASVPSNNGAKRPFIDLDDSDIDDEDAAPPATTDDAPPAPSAKRPHGEVSSATADPHLTQKWSSFVGMEDDVEW
jgi:hypothetical protein